MTKDVPNYRNKLPSWALIWLTGLPFLGWAEEDTLSLASLLPSWAIPRLLPQGPLPSPWTPGAKHPQACSPAKPLPHLELRCPPDLERLSSVSSAALFNYDSFLLNRPFITSPWVSQGSETGLGNSALPVFSTPLYSVMGSLSRTPEARDPPLPKHTDRISFHISSA